MGLARLRPFTSLFKKKPKHIGLSQNAATGFEESLYRKIFYRFNDKRLLKQALTHRSCFQTADERSLSNERLEFLGDAVLGMVVTETLYHRYPEKSEGDLTRMKSLMVSRDVLARQAEKLDLGHYLILGTGEDQSGGRQRRSILSDTFEALLGAMYLDGGFDPAQRFVLKFLYRDMKRFLKEESSGNYKSMLLEYTQREGPTVPKYRVIRESGPDHKKEFTVEVMIRGEALGVGMGHSKKKAEQEAALKAVKALGLLNRI